MNGEEPASVDLRAVDVSLQRREVLGQINLSVLPGELFVLLGGAGSGKSTLLRAIAGLDPIDAGEIWIDDRQVTRLAPRKRGAVLLPQSYPLWPHMTVADNVGFALRGGDRSTAPRRARIAEELGFVGLVEFDRHLPQQLSAGQRQRVALARTLAASARVHLLDEPFAAQEVRHRERLRRLLRQRQQQSGITTLLATQDWDEALRAADRIALLHEGRLQQVGTPVELYDSPATRHVAAYMGSVNLLDGEVEYSGEQPLFHTHEGIVIPLFDHPVKRARTGSAMFRPHDLQILRRHEEPFGDQIRLRGRIEQSEFRGDSIRYTIDLSGSSVWMDLTRAGEGPTLNVGDRVVVGLDPTRIRILES